MVACGCVGGSLWLAVCLGCLGCLSVLSAPPRMSECAEGAPASAAPAAPCEGRHTALPLSELLSPSLLPHAPPTAAAQRATRAAFAPGGTGLLLVTGLPRELEALRAALLARAPALPPRAALLAEHGLGSDTSGPGAPASATLQLAWGQGGPAAAWDCAASAASAAAAARPASPLRADMEALGSAWAAVCAAVAGACDAWIPGGAALAPALLAAREAKARLIYYGPGPAHEPWQAWHKDYGLFTAVSAPLYWEGGGGGDVAGAATQQQLLPLAPLASQPPGAGLHVLCAGGSDGSGARVLAAGLEGACLAVQVGEAAQVLSGGALAAVPHCVLRAPAASAPACSRATFVVFCQPPSEAPMLPCCAGAGADAAGAAAARVHAAEHPSWAAHLRGVVPPLAARWPGPGGAAAPCTFTGFGRSTVKAYYGKAGTQKRG